MKRQTLRGVAVASALLWLVNASLAGAQVTGIKRLPPKRAESFASQAPTRPSITPASPSYTFTLLSYPGQLYTAATCINKGATTSKTAIVGGYGSNGDFTQAGFLARVSGTKTVTEVYESVSYPHEPAQQVVDCINDLGQIVGVYIDSSNISHGYERIGGKFSTIDVTFSGATGTIPFGINNSGEIVGCWVDGAGNEHGYTLIGNTYTSFDYPGGSQTCFLDVNNAGDIVGIYYDASGDGQSFLFSGGTYTSFAFPGAVETEAGGINDAGVIVGAYCLTTECVPDFNGAQGFVLSGGVFTTVTIPGEVYTSLDDINNDGVMLGYYQDAAGLLVSFLARP